MFSYVIDADESMRRLITYLAQQAGVARVAEFARPVDAQQALELALIGQGELPSLIVTEIDDRPGCDGAAFCRWLSGQPVLNELPVVVLVPGEGDPETLQQVFSTGVFDAVFKHNAPTELLIRLSAAMRFALVQESRRSVGMQLERELTLNQAVMLSLSQMGEGLFILEEGRLSHLNPALCALTGFSAAEIYAWADFIDGFHPSERERVRDLHQRRLSGKPADYRYHTALLHRDGSRIDVELILAELDTPSRRGLVGLVRDIRDQLALQRRLEDLAHYDQLTGLPNRRLLHDRLTQALYRAVRGQVPLAVLFCDLDGFKAVNDRYGHSVGDELLVQVAERLRQALRAMDTAARLAGDEFVLVLESDMHGGLNAEVVAVKLVRALSLPYTLSIGNVDISVSIGVALTRVSAADTVDSLMHEADAAMYRAKQGGKNGYFLLER